VRRGARVGAALRALAQVLREELEWIFTELAQPRADRLLKLHHRADNRVVREGLQNFHDWASRAASVLPGMLHRWSKGRERVENEVITPQGPSMEDTDFMEVKRARWHRVWHAPWDLDELAEFHRKVRVSRQEHPPQTIDLASLDRALERVWLPSPSLGAASAIAAALAMAMTASAAAPGRTPVG
jgi:hypothetical protein